MIPLTTVAHPTPCVTCGCTTVTQRAWRAATGPQRAAWRDQGANVRHGRGRCFTCYQRLYRQGHVPCRATGVAPADVPPRPCDRCGIPTTHGDMCLDCVDLTHELCVY